MDNFFDSEGRFIRRLPTVDGRTQSPVGVFLRSGDCRRFLVTDDVYEMPTPEGPEGLTYWDLAWTDESFIRRDTVTRAIANHVFEDGPFIRYPPWTTHVYPIRLAGDNLLFGYSQRAELRDVAPDGDLVRILRWHAPPDPITAEERQRWNEGQRVGESGRRIQLSDFPWLPEHKAFFDLLLADDEGNIWVRTPPPPDPVPEQWTVLGSDGRWLGVVPMPGRLQAQPGRARPRVRYSPR